MPQPQDVRFITRKTDKVTLYNPRSELFTDSILDDNNQPIAIAMRPGELTSFEEWLADVIAKHLATTVYNERDHNQPYEEQMQGILDEIYARNID